MQVTHNDNNEILFPLKDMKPFSMTMHVKQLLLF